MLRPFAAWSVVVALLPACRERAGGAGDAGDAASAVAVTAPTGAKNAATTATADAGAAAVTGAREAEAKRLVTAWSAALDKHDIDALAKLYAPNVFFYKSEISRAAVLDAKRSALGPTSTFRQQIVSDLEVAPQGSGFAVTFTKRSGSGGKMTDSRAIVAVGGEPLAITEERDAPKDTRAGDCESVVAETVRSLPAVKTRLDAVDAELKKFPQRRAGGMGPIRDDDGSVSGSYGVHGEERYEGIVLYTVSRAGKLEVTAPDPVPVPAAAAAKVAAACKAK